MRSRDARLLRRECTNGDGFSCPSAPNPYCPSGDSELAGTGFDVWGSAGGTGWLRTTAPVSGGAIITIRFAIWDGGDQAFDSSVLIDDFEWITEGSVTVGTGPN